MADDVTLIMPEQAPLVGREVVVKWLMDWYAQVEVLNAEIHILEVSASASGDLAFDTAFYRLRMRDRRSQTEVSEEGHHLVVWRKAASQWFIARDASATVAARVESPSRNA